MFRIFDLFFFTLERLRQHIVLVFWVLVGLSSATTLALSLVLYVDAVNTDLLSSKLEDPPYAFRFRYVGSWEGNITREDVVSANAAIERDFINRVGLPIGSSMQMAVSVPWRVELMTENDGTLAVGPYNLAAVDGILDKIRLVDGEWPVEQNNADAVDVPVSDSGQDTETATIPVLLSEVMLFEMGLQVGDTLRATLPGLDPIMLEIAAFWQPINENDPTWIFVPSFFEDRIIIAEEDLWTVLDGAEREPIEEAAWYIVFNGVEVRTADVPFIITSVSDGERDVSQALPGVRLNTETVPGLREFSDDVNQLTQQLVIILLPVGGLVLYFVSLVAGLLVSRQQQEDVILRSRGMGRGMLISVYVLMWLLLAGLALAIGLALSPFVVQLVGQTTSFLEFDGTEVLEVVFTQQALLIGTGTALLAASSGLFMAWRSARQNINSYRRQQVRARQAWWQRIYLDILLLIPGFYVLYTLRNEGGLATSAEDPFADPLTFVGPTLFALGMTLLFLRVWPFTLRILSGLISYTSSIATLMALRELTRSIGRYRGTLLMMCFTLSLTGLTASMASTIDRSLRDSVDYNIGADAVVITAVDTQAEQDSGGDDGQQTFTVTGFNTLPPDDVLDVDGVRAVSRVGEYPVRLALRNQRLEGAILGVDRASMASVTRSREDFADMQFADMFNLLALDRSGVLVNRQTVVDNNLLIGQQIDIQISILGEWYETQVPILGVLDYFPTLDPRDGVFLIGNIEPIFELAGTELPHDLWLGLDAGTNPDAVLAGIREQGFPVLQFNSPESALADALAEPSRRGVLGFLSVGFVASIVLTLVGTIIQNTASFRAQAVQLGSMRAMGLRGIKSSIYLILLQGIAAVSGIAGGTVIGVVTTQLFLPLLDFSGGLPPYLVRVAWDEIIIVYGIFAGVLFAVTLLTTFFASLQQLTNIVKIGDV